jgi:hypothetical protein
MREAIGSALAQTYKNNSEFEFNKSPNKMNIIKRLKSAFQIFKAECLD